MGIPTLDGLGGWGDGAHSESEYLRISQYIPRIALLASLILISQYIPRIALLASLILNIR